MERLERPLETGATLVKPEAVVEAVKVTPPPASPATAPVAAKVLAPDTPARPVLTTPEAHESDLESRIGSHWLNRIGIAAVLIGVSYFLKFAFDNNWIGP